MADYIYTGLYKYIRPVYVTEPTGVRQTYIPLKLNLNSSNFNFDLARFDGLDFHLAERSNGSGVLKMWIAYWNTSTKKATVWFKLPELLASETKILYAIWGYESDSGMSDIESMLNPNPVFLFADGFDNVTLYSNKWPTTLGSYSIGSSTIQLGVDAWIRSSQILGGQITNYVGSPTQVSGVGGLWGAHQSSGNCYLGTSQLYTGADELVDGVKNIENTNSLIYLSGTGCNLGVDLGIVVENISKVRVYLYNILENTPNNSFISPAYAILKRSDTNDANSYVTIYNYNYEEMILIPHAPYVWYFDLHFDSPGQDFRYLMLQAGLNFQTNMNYDVTEIEIFVQNSTTTTGPGNFIVEEGIVGIGSPSSTTVPAHRYRFYDGDNVLGIDYYWEGSTDRRHDFITAGSYATYNGINRGLIIGEYNQAYIAYYEPTDRVYQGMTNRGGEATPIYSEDLATDGDRAIASTTNAGNPTAWLAKNAVDGSDSTQWLAGSTDANPWWGYSFSSAEAITRLIINVAALRYITVQGSNDPTASWDSKIWTTVYTDPTPQYAYELFTLDLNNSTPYKYWRLTSVGLGTTGIYEIEMLRINSYSGEFDYDDSWERKVHRNTAVSNFRIYGADLSSAVGVRIDWVIAREFKPDSDPLVNYSGLWIDYEYVAHQSLDYAEYTDDITSVDFYHLSDMGGDPYRVSDNVTNSLLNIFTSDNGITVGSIIIDFGRYNDNVTNNDYIHFNSDNSVEFYNASKLSDLDTDVYDRSYWQTTTTSGWAAIEFPSTKDISCLAMRAVPGQTDRMAKTFKFYGSQSNPRFRGWNDKILIYEGSARQIEDEQAFYFYTGLTFYKYYILDVLDTHGGNIAIQEWGMYERNSAIGKKVISQLRLHPVAFEDNEYYFPKQIELYGSNDGFIWNTLIYNTDTPTPFTDYAYGRWSRYSFENFEAYYQYKLRCLGDWHPSVNQIKIAEWEMVESIEEVNNIRILGGSSNNMNNIWADPTTTMNSGVVYITNDAFNTIEHEKLISSVPIEGAIAGGYWQDTNQSAVQTTGGTATASLSTYQDYELPYAFDGSLSTYWHSVEYYTYPIWVQYLFTQPQRITYMRMYPRTSFTARMPGDFILKGSNTGAFSGEETDIVSITGATYINEQWTGFNFTNTAVYLYYRIHITNKAVGTGDGGNNNSMNIFEIEMIGYTQVWIPEYELPGVTDFNVKL